MKKNRFLRVLRVVPIALAAATVFGFVVMGLWNALMPVLFGLHVITFWQALGLIILSRLFFGGFRGRPGHGGPWRRRMIEGWEQMTPEQRAQFREGLRRGGRGGNLDTPPAAEANPS
jgi:hypothetical protein